MLTEWVRSSLDRLGLPDLTKFNWEMFGFDFRFAVYAVVFLGVLMAFEGLRQLTVRGENHNEARNRRMRMLSSGMTEEQILVLLKPKTQKGFLSNLPFIGDLPTALRAAGMTISPNVFASCCAVGFVLMVALGSQIVNPMVAFFLAAYRLCGSMAVVWVDPAGN